MKIAVFHGESVKKIRAKCECNGVAHGPTGRKSNIPVHRLLSHEKKYTPFIVSPNIVVLQNQTYIITMYRQCYIVLFPGNGRKQ